MNNNERTDGIYGFDNEFGFMSNFHHAPFRYRGVKWQTSEHAYQAAKCQHPADYNLFRNPNLTAAGSKRLIKTLEQREEFHDEKDQLMYEVVSAKFSQNNNLRKQLLMTEDLYIEETNYWGDVYWGVCNGTGKNKLGQILMRVREDLRIEDDNNKKAR